MANDCAPFFDPGDSITCHVSADVKGKTLVKITGQPVGGNPQVGPATAGTGWGVAARDAAAGSKVLVYRGSLVVPITAGANLSAGAFVTADANAELALADTSAPATAVAVAGQLLADVADGADGIVALSFSVMASAS